MFSQFFSLNRTNHTSLLAKVYTEFLNYKLKPGRDVGYASPHQPFSTLFLVNAIFP